MEATEPLSSILHPPNSTTLSHPRRRRTSLSGKLFNLFTTKPKSPPQPPPRPIISLPQPLPGRIPVPPKRAYRELSNDENAPPSPSPRPRARLRLHSDTSVASVNVVERSPSPERKIHSPPKGDRARPLKSALKKSASENTPVPFSPTYPTRTPIHLLYPPYYRQDSTVPFPPPPPSKPQRSSKVTKRVPGGAWMPFSSSRNHAARAASEDSRPRSLPTNTPRKTVTFALEQQPKRSSSQDGHARDNPAYNHPGATSHWDEIAAELDTPATPVDPSSHLKRKAEDYPDRSGGTVTFRPGSPTITRSRTPVFTPQSPYRGSKSIDASTARCVSSVPKPAQSDSPPGRTFIGGIVDEWIEEYAREKLRSPPPNTRALARRKDSLGSVLRRITADIVPNERHSTIWDAGER